MNERICCFHLTERKPNTMCNNVLLLIDKNMSIDSLELKMKLKGTTKTCTLISELNTHIPLDAAVLSHSLY